MFRSGHLSRRASEFDTLIKKSVFTFRNKKQCSLETGSHHVLELFKSVREHEGYFYILGNGGSAAVASHICTDFCNTGRMRASTLHEPALLTCFSNDYGYENAYAMQVQTHVRSGDVVIAVSSSGRSRNIVNAVEKANDIGASVLTLTGFACDNPVRSMGDINYWIDSSEYGMVEIGHLFVLHYWAEQMSTTAVLTPTHIPALLE